MRQYLVKAGTYNLAGKKYKQGDIVTISQESYAVHRTSIEGHVTYGDLTPYNPQLEAANEERKDVGKKKSECIHKEDEIVDVSKLSEKNKDRVKDTVEDLEDDGKRNRSNRRRKKVEKKSE